MKTQMPHLPDHATPSRVAILSLIAGAVAVITLYPSMSQHARGADTQASATLAVGVTISIRNPLQVATLHWYSANQAATFATGNAPTGVVLPGVPPRRKNGVESVRCRPLCAANVNDTKRSRAEPESSHGALAPETEESIAPPVIVTPCAGKRHAGFEREI